MSDEVFFLRIQPDAFYPVYRLIDEVEQNGRSILLSRLELDDFLRVQDEFDSWQNDLHRRFQGEAQSDH
jgi:hypothetical protein